jgi:hypothetical protein
VNCAENNVKLIIELKETPDVLSSENEASYDVRIHVGTVAFG